MIIISRKISFIIAVFLSIFSQVANAQVSCSELLARQGAIQSDIQRFILDYPMAASAIRGCDNNNNPGQCIFLACIVYSLFGADCVNVASIFGSLMMRQDAVLQAIRERRC